MMSHLVEEAAKKIPNVPFLVNVVSKRVRQLSAGHRPMIEATPKMGFADIALQEIIEGKLNYELKPVEEGKE
jgi:DNA-directed RNA polymerase subunit omega